MRTHGEGVAGAGLIPHVNELLIGDHLVERDSAIAGWWVQATEAEAPALLDALVREETRYEQLGGEAGVRRLVERFYAYMDELPEAADTRALHARNLKGSIEKLYLFLSGWLGGPNLYQQKYGHPMLRRRHLPFPPARLQCRTIAATAPDLR